MIVEEKRKKVFEIMKNKNLVVYDFGKSRCIFYSGIKSEEMDIDGISVYNVWDTSTDLYKHIKESDLDLIMSEGLQFLCDKIKVFKNHKKILKIKKGIEDGVYTNHGKKVALSYLESIESLVSDIVEKRKNDAKFLEEIKELSIFV